MRIRGLGCVLVLVFSGAVGGGVAGDHDSSYSPSADQKRALEGIQANSLRGHLSFLASDLLQGRSTPSPGQDIAAEYIAAQFRRAGLEPAGDHDYFQNAPHRALFPNPADFRFVFASHGNQIEVPPNRFRMTGVEAVELVDVPLVKIPFSSNLDSAKFEGKAVMTEIPAVFNESSRRAERLDFIDRVTERKAALLILIDRDYSAESAYFTSPQLATSESGDKPERKVLTAVVSDSRVGELFDSLPGASLSPTITLHVSKPMTREVLLRNVAGLLRGSDPVLKDSYILVSAHYDGTGRPAAALGDTVWNAANDDGSGTASIIEIAAALSSLTERPRRTILFIAFFGEEKGLLGSRFYGEHPLVPVEQTVAGINLEQVGRTDSTEGDKVNKATVTGFDYSTVGSVIREAGKEYGLSVYKAGEKSDDFFSRSDNQTLADLGIPSHTLSVALEFPDYHGSGDKWEKIDFDNMARVTRVAALAVLAISQSEKEPRWDSSNSDALRYQRAWEERHQASKSGTKSRRNVKVPGF